MIILDTNVVSELMRTKPDSNVISWLGKQKTSGLYITAITVAEIGRGLGRLPKGKRKSSLEAAFNKFTKEAFGERILSFDLQAAQLYGTLAAQREKAGMHVDAVDLLIAAIALNHQAQIASRNTGDFSGCGISLINPWLD